MNNELKQIKLESVYKDAYIDRYRRLGYSLVSDISVAEHGEDYSLLVFRRDRSQPNYARLAEIEKEVDELCVKAKQEQSVVDGTRLHRRAALGSLMAFGLILMCIGVVLTVTGLVYSELYAAFAGWAGVFAGAVLIIIFALLREKWRMRAVDRRDDAEHPGFGIDRYSKEVENKLKEAELLAA